MSGLINSAGSKSGVIGYDRNPEVPAFYAYGFSGTEDSTHGTVPFNSTKYNVGYHYSTSSYAFTAPVKGLYSFTLNIALNGVSDSVYYFGFNFIVGGVAQTWMWIWENSKAHDYWTNCINREFQMDAGDTSYVSLNGAGTGQFTSMRGGATDCTFSGFLIG